MKLTAIHFTKKSIETLPDIEKMLFCQVTILQTELDILKRIAIATANGWDKSQDEEIGAQFIQLMFVTNIMSGKIYEGWKTIRSCIYSESLGREYAASFSNESKHVLREIKNYFSDHNIINYIRQNFAFHYDKEVLSQGYALFDDSYQFSMYGNEWGGNALSKFGYEIILRDLLHHYNPEDERLGWRKGMPETVNKLYGEITGILTKLQVVCEEILRIIASKHDSTVSSLPVPDPDYLEDLRLPYFVRIKKNSK